MDKRFKLEVWWSIANFETQIIMLKGFLEPVGFMNCTCSQNIVKFRNIKKMCHSGPPTYFLKWAKTG